MTRALWAWFSFSRNGCCWTWVHSGSCSVFSHGVLIGSVSGRELFMCFILKTWIYICFRSIFSSCHLMSWSHGIWSYLPKNIPNTKIFFFIKSFFGFLVLDLYKCLFCLSFFFFSFPLCCFVENKLETCFSFRTHESLQM